MINYNLIIVYLLFNLHFMLSNPLIFFYYLFMIFIHITITKFDNFILLSLCNIISDSITLLFLFNSSFYFILFCFIYIFLLKKLIPNHDYTLLIVIFFNDFLFNFIKLNFNSTKIGNMIFNINHHVLSIFIINLLNTFFTYKKIISNRYYICLLIYWITSSFVYYTLSKTFIL